MDYSNWFLPVQPDRNERQSNMDQRASLLKLVIERIELKQKNPTFYVRSSPTLPLPFELRLPMCNYFCLSNSRSGDRPDLAFEMAMLDAVALWEVVCRVGKNDNLYEILRRAIRSVCQAIPNIKNTYGDNHSLQLPFLRQCVYPMPVSVPRSKQENVDSSESHSEMAIAHTLHAFLTSVLHLLTLVFQYLIGYVDRGGSKTYSSGAFDFRASFVSLVLFQGAYVWIKFRQAAQPGCRKRKAPDVVDIEGCNLKGLRKRSIKNSSGAFIRFKYEPRFTPPRQEGEDGVDLRSKRLPLGEEKWKWVTCAAKQVGKQMYANFQTEKEKHLAMATEPGSHGAEFNDPSSSALPLPCPSLPMGTTMAAEPAIASAAPSSPSLSLLPFDGAVVGDGNDFSESRSGVEDMIAELYYDPGLSNLPDQQLSVVSYQMQCQASAPLPEDPSLLEVGAVPGGIEHDSEPNLIPNPNFQEGRVHAVAGTENIDGTALLQQRVPDLQQPLRQKKWPEDIVSQNVDLDHQLKVDQMQISKLQQEKEQLRSEKEQLRSEKEQLRSEKEQLRSEKEQLRSEKEQLRSENESLKSRLEQVAKAQVATWTGIMIDIQRRD